ncbi:4-hydroxy-tetrahydrodipicolinate synthase, partial [Nostoc sp. HG1]|nr:4-hydroxy-tetrahydrodipicolinate synthase [Nostoc sp. HG1]
GTTGESPTVTTEEHCEIIRVSVEQAAGRVPIMAGCGSNSTAEAVNLARYAQQVGADCQLQVVPYYNKPPQSGLYQHFKAIAQASSDLPIMLYNVPGRTSQNLLPETIAQLAEIPNIVAVKEASGDLDQASQIRQLTPADFAIYSGDDSLTLPLLAVGGQGVVSVASHLVGSQLQQMIQAFEVGQVQTAAQIHLKLFSLFKALFITTNPIPVKEALKLQGWDVGSYRLPLCDPDDSVRATLKRVMAELNLLKE